MPSFGVHKRSLSPLLLCLLDMWNGFNFFLVACLVVGALIPKWKVQKFFQILR